MMRFTWGLAVLLALAATPAPAQRARLDDSLSLVESHPVELGWSQGQINTALQALAAGADGGLPPMSGRIPGVQVRLKTRDFVGRAARIFLTLPVSMSGVENPADLELRWEASGAFLPGSLRPGQSTLVFEGVIEQDVTSVIFDFLLLLENPGLSDTFTVEPFYEIEVLP
jgi:hypothetical protein